MTPAPLSLNSLPNAFPYYSAKSLSHVLARASIDGNAVDVP